MAGNGTAETAAAAQGDASWWAPLPWSCAAIMVGAFLLALPDTTASVLLTGMAIIWLVGGVFDLIGYLFRSKTGKRIARGRWQLITGALSVVAGLVILENRFVNAVLPERAQFIIVGIVALITGATRVIAALLDRKARGDAARAYGGAAAPVTIRTRLDAARTWTRFTLGALQIVIGVCLFTESPSRLAAVVWVVGLCATIGGIMVAGLTVQAWRATPAQQRGAYSAHTLDE